MEQLRQVGEALGGVAALMAFHHELRVNPRQCRLLADACALAFDAVAGEVRAHLRFDDRLVGKWRPLESPLRELHRAVRDADHYIRHCLGDTHGGGGNCSSWWARAAAATHGAECVELHMHNLLWCVAVVLEAVEAAAEAAASCDPDELARQRVLFARDYDKDLLDPALFRRSKAGMAYLATQELAARIDTAWKEDRWLLSQLLDEMKQGSSKPLSRQEHRLADLLAAPRGKLHPGSALLAGGDFQIRRRLGGSLKEAQWMGEAIAVKHYIGVDADDAAAGSEIALLTSVAHPNVAHCRYCFHDEEKREAFLVMDQLMSKDLGCYVKEVTGGGKRTPRAPLPLVVVVDTMLQIARGMEHLHSKNIYHGDLNPSNVLVKQRHGATDGYVHVKVAGFGGHSTAAETPGRKASQAAVGANTNANAGGNGNANPCIWSAPEVLENDEAAAARRTEKADVYSFGMICFELITGKIPFEDNHLQGENMSKNIRAGERPLFPFQAPKYLTGLTRRCWHADPAQRPAFSSICRVLRYVKRFLVLNPEQPDAPAPTPAMDYLDIEALLLKKLPAWQGSVAPSRVSDVPFEMYAYRVMEKEKGKAPAILHISDSGSDGNSLCGDESVHSSATLPDIGEVTALPTTWSRSLSARSSGRIAPSLSSPSRPAGKVAATKAGSPQKSRSMGVFRQPPPQLQVIRRTPRIMSDGQLQAAVTPQSRRRVTGGNASDSELA